jgi:phospholipid/cholesterol/gamma-HCH transport system ATP-binding protein
MAEQRHADPAIRVTGLRKAFGAQVVLDGIDLDVARGETLTVLGRSGGGKSVLLKLLIGLQTPDAGSIHIDGRELAGLPPDALNELRKKLGFLFQQAALYDSLTVGENVAFPLRRHTDLPDDERERRVRELLSRMGMENDLDKLPEQISGGMKKRVGLARALALDPEILFFDEPSAGLDPVTSMRLDGLILELSRGLGATVVIVSHELPSLFAICDDGVFLDAETRTAIAHGSPRALRDGCDHPTVRAFMERGRSEAVQGREDRHAL